MPAGREEEGCEAGQQLEDTNLGIILCHETDWRMMNALDKRLTFPDAVPTAQRPAVIQTLSARTKGIKIDFSRTEV